jgi:hypothetical protein
MKKTSLLLMILALAVTSVCGQTPGPFGIRVVYTDNGETTERTFRSDSISAWGYDNGNVFVQPEANQPTLSFPMQNLIRFEYPPIVPDSTSGGSADYLVVNVNGQKAAFLLADGFEMTWRSGVLSIKDKNQSQSIGLRTGITFTVEKLSFGYTNPGISSTPGSGSFYLVTESYSYSGVFQKDSFAGTVGCIYVLAPDPILRFVLPNNAISVGIGVAKLLNMYMSDTVVGFLW